MERLTEIELVQQGINCELKHNASVSLGAYLSTELVEIGRIHHAYECGLAFFKTLSEAEQAKIKLVAQEALSTKDSSKDVNLLNIWAGIERAHGGFLLTTRLRKEYVVLLARNTQYIKFGNVDVRLGDGIGFEGKNGKITHIYWDQDQRLNVEHWKVKSESALISAISLACSGQWLHEVS